ncbi:acetyl-CoA carboxylase carboxyltransferase subunit alpha [Spirillospora sp. NBC_01491]|uniref:acetyl-CoA carboxylase carboxyltransferase subunit alpha n=1 Tax=Spirillospora sp. NBC_01491 TaxID=2976007 RepID=UPI002E314E3A|nr:acetyl-CoA carboxylase carboxyltransferase subunit alpha [Spirillospora sp. NBC_01491]
MSTQTMPTDAVRWYGCPACRELTYGKRFDRSLRVCPGCGAHSRLTARRRIAQLLDEGSVIDLDDVTVVEDPLGFADSRPYPERMAQARADTGEGEAVTCVTGTLRGHPVVAAVMDFRFMGGSLGVGVGEHLVRAARVSLRTRAPFLLVTASGGARMQEGAFSLMQMVKTSQALAELDEAGVLTISVITDPTYGGVAASFATLPDVIFAEPGARIGFAGPRVIQQTIRQALPDGFQTAEFMLERGFVDAVVPRAALRPALGCLLAVRLGAAPAAPPPAQRARGARGARLVRDPGELPARDAWEVVGLARHQRRPTTVDYIRQLLDDFQELRGDRVSGDCPAIVGGTGRLDGRPVMVIGHQKGRGTADRIAHNFGMASPAGYRKAGRLMRLAAKLRLPIVTLVDTPGAHPGVEAEERGQAWAIAENIRLMSGLPVPIVSAVVGEGGSGGALALAVADRVLAFAGAVYSVISPEGCAAILWKDRELAPLAASTLRLDARDLLRQGIVDAVVPEPDGGAHEDPVAAGELLRGALTATLDELADMAPADLVRHRRARFGAFGVEERGAHD